MWILLEGQNPQSVLSGGLFQVSSFVTKQTQQQALCLGVVGGSAQIRKQSETRVILII